MGLVYIDVDTPKPASSLSTISLSLKSIEVFTGGEAKRLTASKSSSVMTSAFAEATCTAVRDIHKNNQLIFHQIKGFNT